MKQNLSDAQSKGSHLPSQINLLTSSMKAKSGAEAAGACEPGSYVDGSAEVSSPGQTELRHRHGSQGAIPANQTHLTAPNSGPVGAHKTSINSIDLVDVIEAQQQSLAELASQYNGSSQPQVTPTMGVITCSSPSANGCQQLKSDFCDNLSASPDVKKKDLTTVVQMTTTTKNGLANGAGDGAHESSTEKTVTSSSADEDDKQKWSHVRRLLAGVSLTILSALCFSITTVIVKFVTDIKPSQMALFRYLGTCFGLGFGLI